MVGWASTMLVRGVGVRLVQGGVVRLMDSLTVSVGFVLQL